MNDYSQLIQQLYILSGFSVLDMIEDGTNWRRVLHDAAAAIADLSSIWTPTSGVGAAAPALDNHYDDPGGISYDYSRRVLGRENCDSPVKIVVYLRDAEGKTSWCSDTDETLSIALWAPLPL